MSGGGAEGRRRALLGAVGVEPGPFVADGIAVPEVRYAAALPLAG